VNIQDEDLALNKVPSLPHFRSWLYYELTL
jgi:hypothetical protein